MVLHDRGYQRWHGSRDTGVPGARVIAEQGVASAVAKLFKRKFAAMILLVLSYGSFVFGLGVLTAVFYLRTNIEKFPDADGFLNSELVEVITPSAKTAWLYIYMLQCWFVLLLSLIVGMGLIAEDRRSNALELYLSRPIRVWQYVVGKLGVLAFFFGAVTVAPALLLLLAQMSFVGFEPEQTVALLELGARVTVACGVTGLVMAAMTLAVSSLAKRARNAAVLWVGFWLVTTGILEPILNEEVRGVAHLLSLRFHLQHAGALILGTTADYDGGPGVIVGGEPATPTVIVLSVVTLISTLIVLRRVRPVEVVA